MSKTTIEWASHTWNPYTWDCTKVSPGCQNCYMMTMAERYHRPQTGVPLLRKKAYRELKNLPTGAVIFVNSMSDTYHESVPVSWVHSIHNQALLYPQYTFLILTKRPERALALSPHLAYPKNLWVGTSVENADYLWRLEYLLRIPAAGHFLSAEPLLGSLVMERGYASLLDYLYPLYHNADNGGGLKRANRLQWVIVGGESGANRRPMDKAWAMEILIACRGAGVPFMYKQGNAFRSGSDRELAGQTWDETPFQVTQEA